jgi:HSP20 family protein
MSSRVPAVNIAEVDSKYHIELAVPGMIKEDFKISLDRNMFSIPVENSVKNSD